jgi:pimeloyl-ACP methyl ester carboxylesterase
MGAGGRAARGHLHQVWALVKAGYRVITYDLRGAPPSDPENASMTVGDLVADLAGLIEHLDAEPCRLGTLLGATSRPAAALQSVWQSRQRSATSGVAAGLTKILISNLR